MSNRYINQEIADVMCAQAEARSAREENHGLRKEIERLKARLATVPELTRRCLAAETRIEELERGKKYAEVKIMELGRANKRVWELEGERTHLNERLGWTDEEWKKKHLIDNEMIDSILHEVEWLRDSIAGGIEEDHIDALYEALGIERCEGCGGSGRFEAVGLYEDCEDCAKWGGKGWVIGDSA